MKKKTTLRPQGRPFDREREVVLPTSEENEFVSQKLGSTIVQGTGIAVGMHEDQSSDTDRIRQAMEQAVLQAAADGITDPDVIRARIQAARDAAVGA